MIEHTTHFYCGECGWALPPVEGPVSSHTDRTLPMVGEHIDATGHSTRLTVMTRDARYPGTVETSTVLLQRP